MEGYFVDPERAPILVAIARDRVAAPRPENTNK